MGKTANVGAEAPTPGEPFRKWHEEGEEMLDIIFIACTVAFFALAVLYVRGCERLK